MKTQFSRLSAINPKSAIRNSKFLVFLCALLFAFSFPVEAQQPKKVPRIGFLLAPARSAVAESLDAFRQGLRELGYAEGQNIVIEYRYAEGQYDRLPALAVELVRLQVDVIVTAGGARVAQAAKETTTQSFADRSDAERCGFEMVG